MQLTKDEIETIESYRKYGISIICCNKCSCGCKSYSEIINAQKGLVECSNCHKTWQRFYENSLADNLSVIKG